MTRDVRPQGFDKIMEAAQEFDRARANNKGQRNTRVEVDPLGTTYTVSEETRRLPWGNSSTQAVRWRHTDALIGSDSVELESHQNGNTAVLSAHSDGQVYLTTSVNGTYASVNITEAATRSGITAADIRRTQQDIASDGEITRPDQQRIIDTINQAKRAAGIA